MNNCPCCSQKLYEECCGIYLSGTQHAPTPELLMRSRYTAYALKNLDYIVHTMQSPASDHFDLNNATEWANRATFFKLEIVDTSLDTKKGFVEFRAHYSLGEKNHTLHERSEFRLENGKWFYVNGVYPNQAVKKHV